MDIKALQLESRFSLAPNSLGYCGRDSAPEKFKKCIITGECDGVEEEVTKFIVLYPYLKTLAKITSLPLFSYRIIENYWLGNEELKKAKPKDYELLLDNFLAQGVPDFFVAELRDKKPKVFIPNHLFQVLHVGVGKASGAVPFNMQSINNCMIRWGEVKGLQGGKAKIHLNSLELKENTYRLVIKEETVPFHPDLMGGLKAGDVVAVHWGLSVKILNKQEADNLLFWTKTVCESLAR